MEIKLRGTYWPRNVPLEILSLLVIHSKITRHVRCINFACGDLDQACALANSEGMVSHEIWYFLVGCIVYVMD